MTPPSTHTVHVLTILRGFDEAISSRLPGTKVVNVRTTDLGFDGEIFKKMSRRLTDEELDLVADAEILLTHSSTFVQILKRKGPDSLTRLRWVHCMAVGVDDLMEALGSEPPFVVTRSTDAAAPTLMAEHVVGQILCHERGWRPIYLKQLSKDCRGWGHFQEYRGLAQLTVGVMGVGNMGSATAGALKGFGCRVLGLARVPRGAAAAVPGVDRLWYGREGLPAFLQECDYVVNTLPSTPATRGLLGGDVLSGAARRPVLVNVGRGDVISEADLLRALGQGWLSAALLDCTEREPPAEDSPLWTHPRVAMTPHTSTIANNDFKRESVAKDFCANFAKFFAGQPLAGQVDWQAGY
ncbi:glyoxylate/hydroxypyruvate reductase A-like [Eriocheir sinensis]|uniref:glyoxylate/hydroxypyruvate reductase A-like n=1 Tax=Eriocheir sinensis TaxID=95602 RepID=UPI0021CA4D81|nr:glyoxylate/hydroxypyruvate reductase A-like [Eriocheir sinensis]